MTRLALALALAALVVFSAGASVAQQCSPACDLDGDGYSARPGDYVAFFNALGSSKGTVKFRASADLDDDGAVSMSDFSLLLKFCPIGS